MKLHLFFILVVVSLSVLSLITFFFNTRSTITTSVKEEEGGEKKQSDLVGSSYVKTLLDQLTCQPIINRDIFLRELISNSCDALDKIRFLYLTNSKDPRNDTGDAPTMDIRISINKKQREIIIRDGGVGMTKEEMSNNLVSLKTAGTTAFLKKLQETNDKKNLVGNFDLGFYSAFLVADKVCVASKSDASSSDKQMVWESTADGNFFLYEDPRGNTLGRGTEITLELRKDADEYLDSDKLKDVVHHYSEFIHFPIYLQTEKKVKVPKIKKSEEIKKTEVTKQLNNEKWELITALKPIWTRSPSEITENEYIKYYKSLTTKNSDDDDDDDIPMYCTHLFVEGEVEFKALLFIPQKNTIINDISSSSSSKSLNLKTNASSNNNIHLYIRHVFITDEANYLLPLYLNFLKGVVDSDDFPSYLYPTPPEETRIVRVIKRKLTRKLLDMFEAIVDNDDKEPLSKKRKLQKNKEENDVDGKQHDNNINYNHNFTVTKKLLQQPDESHLVYPKFWKEFGNTIRLGIFSPEDTPPSFRVRLAKLLRYKSSKSKNNYVSLDEYVERMPKAQTAAQKVVYYYLISDDNDDVGGSKEEKIKKQKSPALVRDDIEVLYMTDAIDEYILKSVISSGYFGENLVSVSSLEDSSL